MQSHQNAGPLSRCWLRAASRLKSAEVAAGSAIGLALSEAITHGKMITRQMRLELLQAGRGSRSPA